MSDTASIPTPAAMAETDHHPSVDSWISYHAGEMPTAEGERLQRHLASCRQCLDLVLDLDTFVEPARPDRAVVSDFEKAAVWRAVKSARHVSRWPAIGALAASVLFAALGISVVREQQTIAALESRIASISQPQANAVIEDLFPGARQRSSAGNDPRKEIAAGDLPVVLLLHLAKDSEHSEFELAITAPNGDEAILVPGLLTGQMGELRVTLPPESLPPGEYDLRLFGAGDGHGEPLETYPIRLR
ncbi:MAG: zf-HC2 domain-containing protein [bacterium]|nr:zf-HC2 domain-containing protein [bacterium]